MITNYLSLIAFCLATYLLLSISTGALSLYRTATNTTLSPHAKLRWMLLQIFCPLVALYYWLMFERQKKYVLPGVLLVFLGFGTLLYLLPHIPVTGFSMALNKANHLDAKKEMKGWIDSRYRANPIRLHDELDEKADVLSHKLFEKYTATNKPGEKKAWKNINELLEYFRISYLIYNFPKDQYAAIIAELEAAINKTYIDIQDLYIWVEKNVRYMKEDTEAREASH